jgi:16S rRNA (cytosine1402-N4)-methyltransferase
MSLKNITAHKPVLIKEVLEYLDVKPGNTYIDVTFGSGGHTRAILESNKTCKVIALDWDAQSLEQFGQPLQEEFGNRLQLVWGNFALLYRIVKKEKIPPVSGILADFGTSQMQLAYKPGFSFQSDTPLDMRMSPAHQQVTAADVLNRSSEEKLAQIFFQLGQDSHGRKIARAITEARKSRSFYTTGQLAQLIEKLVPRAGRSIHPATKTFQALRMYVNHEMDNINAFLPASLTALESEGKLVCISFHSLEDGLVKEFFKTQQQLQKITILTKKAVVATDEELQENPSSRSAKLRACEKV